MPSPVSCPDDLLCTEDDVLGLIRSLDVGKASGPDGISIRMLKNTTALTSISCFHYVTPVCGFPFGFKPVGISISQICHFCSSFCRA